MIVVKTPAYEIQPKDILINGDEIVEIIIPKDPRCKDELLITLKRKCTCGKRCKKITNYYKRDFLFSVVKK